MLKRAFVVALMLAAFWVLAGSSMAAQERRIRRNEPASAAQMKTEKRIALVIGNGDYRSSPLQNPLNDAKDMAATLRSLGFDVTERENLNWQEMSAAITSFGQKLLGGGVGLFYYAGHGIQMEGRNYLIPVDSDIRHEREVKYKAIDAGLVLAEMENARNRVNIVILDACRDNPFARSFRSSARGLAPMDAPVGTIIAYATGPNRTASDGPGRNGLYTSELIKQMQIPGMRLVDVFSRVRRAVRKKTNGKQVPWEHTSLEGIFYFKLPEADKPVQLAGGSMVVEEPGAERERGGSLRVETDPSGAKVYVDGSMVGNSPVTVSGLSPGAVGVVVELDGYARRQQRIEIREGRTVRVHLILDPVDLKGRLYVKAEPGDARVRIMNIVPRYREGMELDPGAYDIEVSKEGYRTWREMVDVAAGEDVQLEVKLEPIPPGAGQAGPGSATGTAGRRTWREPTTGMEFVWVPGGCYEMGSPSGEKGRDSDEGPRHEVCVDGFWMGKYEVTNAQYRLFKSSHNSKDYKGHSLNDDSQPVVYVSWNDAKAYARWLSKQNGGRYKFRLPTEAEWEYACRAGTRTARFWGEDPDGACSYANVHDRTSKRVNGFDWEHHDCDDGYAVTAPVGSFAPNDFGLYDMLGNVWEWCEDISNAYSKHQRNNPIYTSGGSARVFRGGGWYVKPRGVRCANRGYNTPGYRNDLLGFRLLRKD